MLNRIDYEEVMKFKRYKPKDTNNSSILYYHNNIIYKLPYFFDQNKIEVINYISECNYDNLIKIKDFIMQEGFAIGYSFKFYDNYKSLAKFSKRDIKLKIKDCHKVIDIFNMLVDNGLTYMDYHCGNILLNPKTDDIKLCDIDSLIADDCINDFIWSNQSAMALCLEYLYGFPVIFMKRLIEDGESLNKDNLINKFYTNITNDNLYDFHNVLEQLDLELLLKEQKTLKPKVKKLKKYI